MRNYVTAFAALIFCTTTMAQNGDQPDATASISRAGIPQDAVQMGVKIGVSDVEQLGDPVMTYGVYGDLALSTNLMVGVGIDYWNKSTGTLSDASVEVSDLIASLGGKYIFTERAAAFRPFAVAGIAVHRFAIKESNKSSDSQVDQLDSDYKDVSGEFGLDFGGGAMYRVRPQMDAVGEVRFRNIMDSGVSLSQLSFTAGLGYIL